MIQRAPTASAKRTITVAREVTARLR
jgi:hypothetical protein